MSTPCATPLARPSRGSVAVAAGGGALLLGILLGCGDASPAAGDREVASAAPSASAAPTVSASAVPTHDPGTVPSAPTPRPPRPSAPPLDPPTFTRMPASPASRADAAGVPGFLDDQRLMLIGDGVVNVIDLESGDAYAIRTGSAISAWATTRDPANVALLERTGRLTVWDATRGALVRSWARPAPSEPDYTAVALSRDGARIAVATDGLVVLDVASGEQRFQKDLPSPAFGMGFTGDVVGVTSNNTKVLAWIVESGAAAGSESFATGGTFGVAISPDARWAAGGAVDGHGLQVADLRGTGTLRQLVGDTTCDAHIAPAFSADSRHVYALGGSKWIKGFDTGTWAPYASYYAPAGRLIDAHADDLSRVLTRDAEGADPRVIELASHREVRLAGADREASFAMSSDGTRVVAHARAAVQVWNATDGALVYRVELKAPPAVAAP